MLRALVIDDEPLARDILCELLDETGSVTVIGQAANAIEGLEMIQQHQPDVLFLDIEMPQLSGLDLLAMLDGDTMPYVVLVTAFEQYAIAAFEGNAFDYLLKPVEPERLAKTLDRLQKRSVPQSLPPGSATLTHIPCSGHQRIRLIAEQDIDMAFSDLAGVHIKTASQQSDTQLTLKTLEQKTSLIRCHRQYLVRLSSVSEIKLLDNGLASLITHAGDTVPVSRRYLKKLKDALFVQKH
ncbi:two-component system response regulator BtsR [Salinimonas lutimaris]|uniref:two-component system response regulator BtsR n=1 Tax=Salinimonas lutimaris TaxID=914153 RepID=UPI0010C0C630|nr:two-component system response regulator BtsR [Salinimonas lutimaris]